MFLNFLKYASEDNAEELFEQLVSLRADFAIQNAIRGFGMEYDEALELVRYFDARKLSKEEKKKRRILIAAIDNLVDFATAEEYQMLTEIPEEYDLEDEHDLDLLLALCHKYNKVYADVENADALYAMQVAAIIGLMADTATLTYMTQQDERVRPWHRQYEGFTALKSKFPEWLVPPIEHGCRCYLIDSTPGVLAKQSDTDTLEMPEWFNPTFKESVAFEGKIFSEEHPYFKIPKDDTKALKKIAKTIKSRYYGSNF